MIEDAPEKGMDYYKLAKISFIIMPFGLIFPIILFLIAIGLKSLLFVIISLIWISYFSIPLLGICLILATISLIGIKKYHLKGSILAILSFILSLLTIIFIIYWEARGGIELFKDPYIPFAG